MKQVMILVEGQTEETFINNVLRPYLEVKSIFITATIVCTKKIKNVRSFRGGITDYHQINRDLERLFKSSHFDIITTFIDFYGLPYNFPGIKNIPDLDSYDKVNFLEKKFADDVNNEKFLPFIMLHEYESLIFCDVYSLMDFYNHNKLSKLHKVLEEHDYSPELINNSPQTAPSKRLLSVLENYNKPLHGTIATKNIGLEKIREMCPHFHNWLTKIENL